MTGSASTNLAGALCFSNLAMWLVLVDIYFRTW